MRQRFVMGNWKLNGSIQQTKELLGALVVQDLGEVKSVVFPSALYLAQTQAILQGTNIQYGVQNVYSCDSGAYTGENSAQMAKEFNARYVLVGHSERRHLFTEDENFVAEKFHHVKEHDMIPVLCVGETLAERESGRTEDVLATQLAAIKKGCDASCFAGCIIAYEPVWAIGTGRTATPEQAQDAHEFIRYCVAAIDEQTAAKLPILYGGSVKASNASSLFAMLDVDGFLVGGASLDATQFAEIIRCIK